MSEKNLQEDLKARQQLIGDTVITCTATYKDGSQKSIDIKVGSEILTGKEAGIDTTAEGKDEVTEDMAAKKMSTRHLKYSSKSSEDDG